MGGSVTGGITASECAGADGDTGAGGELTINVDDGAGGGVDGDCCCRQIRNKAIIAPLNTTMHTAMAMNHFLPLLAVPPLFPPDTGGRGGSGGGL